MKRLTVFWILVSVVALIVLPFPIEAQNYTITDLGVLPGGTYTFPYDINDKGQVCGEADDTVTGDIHGFFYNPVKGMQDIGTLGGTFSNANGLNNLGQVVGLSTTSDDNEHAILWENGYMIDLGVLPGKIISIAYDINDDSKVVGASSMGWGWWNLQTFQAFVWGAIGGMQPLALLPGGTFSRGANGINSISQIVGGSMTADGTEHAVLWEPPGYIPIDLGTLPGAISSLAYGINDTGKVVGWVSTDGSFRLQSFRAFLWDPVGGMQSLGLLLGGSWSAAMDINNSDQVVGEADTTGGLRGFLWSEGVMQDLGIPLGGTYSLAEGINNLGQIAGVGDTPDGETHAVVWTPITPQQRIELLISDVETLLEAGILNQGQSNALTSKLESAISNLNQSNENAAVNQIQAFINQIEALIKGGVLPVSDGQPLIDSANEVINLITG